MSTNLDTEVRALLEARRGDWVEIAEKSAVSYSWISKFVNNRIPNPGYATLTNLKTYLSGTKRQKVRA